MKKSTGLCIKSKQPWANWQVVGRKENTVVSFVEQLGKLCDAIKMEDFPLMRDSLSGIAALSIEWLDSITMD